MKKVLSVLLAIMIFLSMPILIFAETQTAEYEKNAILSALYESDIQTIRKAIDQKVISCEELTQYYLDRIEEYNKPYNCFITLCDDAIEKAREKDALLEKGENSGLLFGVPIVIKDNMNLSGYYTTNGRTLEGLSPATSNAQVVDYLLNQGAIIIGKTNMSTDAQDARASYSKIAGETKNAYNTGLASGGSSGGTAVAVSLNFSVAGLGTDTNSSLRIPAALNGCVSLRPTLNLIPFDGCTHLNSSRDVIGSITRSVYDQAIMLDVLTEEKYSYTENLNSDALTGKNIGILTELSGPVNFSNISESDPEIRANMLKDMGINERVEKNIDAEVMTAFNNAVEELKDCGANVTEVSFPELFDLSYPTFTSHALSYKTTFYNSLKAFMTENNLDALIFPTYLSTPLKSGKDENGKVWNVWQNQYFLNNCRVISPSTGMPEFSLLIGYHSSGAGIGMEILADKNCEQMLLDMAYTYTEKYNHRVPPKDAPDLYADFRQDDLETIVESYTVTVDSQNTETPEIAGNANTSLSNITSIVIIAVSVIIAIIAIIIIVVVIIKTT